jgi:hypothetical protein
MCVFFHISKFTSSPTPASILAPTANYSELVQTHRLRAQFHMNVSFQMDDTNEVPWLLSHLSSQLQIHVLPQPLFNLDNFLE